MLVELGRASINIEALNSLVGCCEPNWVTFFREKFFVSSMTSQKAVNA